MCTCMCDTCTVCVRVCASLCPPSPLSYLPPLIPPSLHLSLSLSPSLSLSLSPSLSLHPPPSLSPAIFLIDAYRVVYVWLGWWPQERRDWSIMRETNITTGSAEARWMRDKKLALQTAQLYAKGVCAYIHMCMHNIVYIQCTCTCTCTCE